MMPSEPVPPPMRHSPAYYDARSNPSSPHAHYRYPQIPPPQRPPVAHVNPTAPNPPAIYRTEPARLQTSVSSGESGSTGASDLKQYLPANSYQYSPQAERGYMEEPFVPARQSHPSSQAGSGINRSNHARTEMIEDNSAVFRYIQQETVVQEEEQENDHALWILVREFPPNSTLAVFIRPVFADLCCYSRCGCPFSTRSTVSSVPSSQYLRSSPSSFSFPCAYVGRNAPRASLSSAWWHRCSGITYR